MGSVMDYMDCPNCGNEAFSDFYYKTGEEYVFCNHCGYHRSATLRRDDDGKLITRDGTLNYEFDNLIMEYNEMEKPYCAYRLKMLSGVGASCGYCGDEDGFNSVKESVEQMEGVEVFSYSRLIDGQILETILINNSKENENG